IQYLLPRATNVRRVFVDNSTTPVTFWVGNNHAASIVKLEPLDAPAPPTQASASAPTIFEGARVVAGDGGPAAENAAFIVDGDRITQVGKTGSLQPPAGARRARPRGKTLRPPPGHAPLPPRYRRPAARTAQKPPRRAPVR